MILKEIDPLMYDPSCNSGSLAEDIFDAPLNKFGDAPEVGHPGSAGLFNNNVFSEREEDRKMMLLKEMNRMSFSEERNTISSLFCPEQFKNIFNDLLKTKPTNAVSVIKDRSGIWSCKIERFETGHTDLRNRCELCSIYTEGKIDSFPLVSYDILNKIRGDAKVSPLSGNQRAVLVTFALTLELDELEISELLMSHGAVFPYYDSDLKILDHIRNRDHENAVLRSFETMKSYNDYNKGRGDDRE